MSQVVNVNAILGFPNTERASYFHVGYCVYVSRLVCFLAVELTGYLCVIQLPVLSSCLSDSPQLMLK